MKTLTVRNVTPVLAEALEEEKKRLGVSMNSTVLHLLSESLNLNSRPRQWTNGLEKLAGGWTEEEFEEFQAVLAEIRVIDEEMWK